MEQVQRELGLIKHDNAKLKQELEGFRELNEGLQTENEELIAQTEELKTELAAKRPPIPRELPLDIASDTYLKDESFNIAQLAWENDIISGREFVDCSIYGPAVLAPFSNDTFQNCVWEGKTPEHVFLEIPADLDPVRMRYVGAITLQNCTFQRCTFKHIAVFGYPEQVKQWRVEATVLPDVGP